MSESNDPRVKAFCSKAHPDLFHSVAHWHEVWREDPFDVDSIHMEAREAFHDLLHRAASDPPPRAGRILLLKGESGSGKTHLMRAFRNYTHSQELGYCAYMQMTTASSNYEKYIVSKLIDSLDHVYCESAADLTGLQRLANLVAEEPHSILPQELVELREDDYSPQELSDRINQLTGFVVEEGIYKHVDYDVLRALMYLQRDDPVLHKHVVKYLRCEELSDYGRHALGGMAPRSEAQHPREMIEMLGMIMGAFDQNALVLCVDQMEEMYNQEEADEKIRRAIGTLSGLADAVPSSVIVISCLEDLYENIKVSLASSIRDRIEHDPMPVKLTSKRTTEEMSDIIGLRLDHLYESAELELDSTDRAFPIPAHVLTDMDGLRSRDGLNWCQEYRKNCQKAGRLVDPHTLDAAQDPGRTSDDTLPLRRLWNDFQVEAGSELPESDEDLMALLGQALNQCRRELDSEMEVLANSSGASLQTVLKSPNDELRTELFISLCNKSGRGGGLHRQIKQADADAAGATPVILRNTEFPSNPNTKAVILLGELVKQGGRRIVVPDSDWRTIQNWLMFLEKHGSHPDLDEWAREERPLTGLKSLQGILKFDDPEQMKSVENSNPPSPKPTEIEEAPGPEPARAESSEPTGLERPVAENLDDPIQVGATEGLNPQPFEILPSSLTRHAAFLGGTGSGKTTLALQIIEELLMRGIPTVLLDRKGDLGGYANPEWGEHSESTERIAQFKEVVDVAVFTPGNPNGRPLAISLVPDGIGELSAHERDHMSKQGADALGSMMNYGRTSQYNARTAILMKAISLMVQGGMRPGLKGLIDFIGGEDPSLINALGVLDPKNCAKLVQDLAILNMGQSVMFSSAGELLDVDLLLGRGHHACSGKTRLSIISTKFLGDTSNIDFWVTQFLMEITRWCSKHPSARLQAVFLFDEADIYLPATRKPATKEPMESLLKRARSAGIGLFLATQSPGDFDYKCRDNINTWFIGRVKEDTAIRKMKAMLSECKTDISKKLPNQTTGQFFASQAGNVTPFKAHRSLLDTKQLTEDEILSLAKRGAKVQPKRVEVV